MKTPLNLKAVALAISISLGSSMLPAPVSAQTGGEWQPVSSEQLVKLPINFIPQTVENDFMESALADDMAENRELSQFKKQTLSDLQAALETATDEQHIELEHQFLMEKSAYLDLMQSHQALRGRELRTRQAIYTDLLARIQREGSARNNPQQVQLMERQQQARERLATSMEDIDSLLSQTHVGQDSPYAEDYNRNLGQLQKLQAAINNHPANAEPMIDGQVMTQEQFVRGLVASIDGQLAVLEQEQEMLSLMARLVALDAQALEYELTFAANGGDSATQSPNSLADAVDYFIN